MALSLILALSALVLLLPPGDMPPETPEPPALIEGVGLTWLPIGLPERQRESRALRDRPGLTEALARVKARRGDPLFLRVYKDPGEIEVWIQPGSQGRFRLLRRYPLCAWSGTLGPKLQEGDHQAPEGFYSIQPAQMNPQSRWHLSFNLGFPNAFDRHHGRTGSFLMVHGDCLSRGCYAIGDGAVEELYVLMEQAFAAGQRQIEVHALPFRMTPERLEAARGERWSGFWQMLAPAEAAFAATGLPPRITVEDGRYRVSAAATERVPGSQPASPQVGE